MEKNDPIQHKLTIFRLENGLRVPYELTLDVRMTVLKEIRGAPVSAPNTGTEARTSYYDQHGYGYRQVDTGIEITYIPPQEVMLAVLVDLSQPIPTEFPLKAAEGLRRNLKDAIDALLTSNPECEPCEIGKLRRRFMDIGREMLQNTRHGQLQTPHPGNRAVPGPAPTVS